MNKKFYKVTQTQLSSLQSKGFITVDGVRYDYDPNSLYILADPFAPEYRLETQGHNLHLLKDNVIISDLTVPFAQASVYASNAKNLQNKTGSKAYTYYDILPRVDYKDFLSINDLPMEGILCGISRNGYFYKVREEGTNTDIPFTLFCQTVYGYYSLSTSEITTPIEGYTIKDYFNEAKFIPYGSIKTVNNTEPDANGNVQLNIPTVNNGRLIIKKNGINQAIFTANQSGDTTADIWVPMKTSELTNDSKFVKNADILLPLSQLSNVKIANLDDALWCADKRFYVIASVHPITVNGVTYPHTDTSKAVTDDNYIVDSTPIATYNNIDNPGIFTGLFDGSTDTQLNLNAHGNHYIKIRIIPTPDKVNNYSPSNSTTSFSHYPYGTFVLTTYYGAWASNVKYACYNKYTDQGVGWKFFDCSNVGPKEEGVGTWIVGDSSNYTRTVLDFWFIGSGTSSKTLTPTSIYWLKGRASNINDENSYFSKYVNEDLVNDVTWKQRGVTTAKISATGSANFKSITEDGQTLTSKYLRAGATAADSAKLNGQSASYYLDYNNLTHKPSAYQLPIATSTVLGGVKSSTTGTTANRDYNVQVKSDGTMKVNVPWTDTHQDISNVVPYTGATKDVHLGKHSLFISNKDDNTNNPVIKLSSKGIEEDDVRTIIEPASISLADPGLSWATLTPAYLDFEDGANSCTVRKDGFTASLKTVGPDGTDITYSAIYKYDGIDVNNKKLLFPSKAGTIALESDINSIKNTYLSKNEAADSYVKKLGSTGEYKVYMSSPAGNDASRTIATAPIGSSVPIRTKEGHILLPDASVSMPAPNEAISAGVADDLYGLDRKTKDFHPTTTLRWLNNSDQREMVINGSWVGFYSSGHQLLILRGDTFTYLDKVVKWSDLADLVENGTVLLNGDTGSIGSYTSVGNGISSALNFAGQNISNTAKGVNSLSLGRLNSVEGAACFAYGNKNVIKGVASIAFGGGNTAGEKIDWTSLDASTNSSSSYCFAIGENNTSIGRASITIGTANNSKGDGSISIGRDNTIWSKESVAIGRNNYLNRVSTGSYEENEPDQGNGVVAIGTGLKTPLRYRDADYSNNFYWNCVISGRYNDPYAYNCVRSSDLVYASNLPPLFTLGNGLSDTSRNNAIVLFHNASAINSDFIYFNEYSIFNKKCEFRGSETIIEGALKDASGAQYIKGGTITTSFINSLF